jgi:hypothetical protein
MYFSDGSAAQYMNRKNFINILYHEQYFGLSAEWSFFTTNQEKGPADGTGGTVKRLAAKASLQRVYNNQIQTLHDLFDYSNSNIHNTTFFYVPEQILNYKKELADRSDMAVAIPGT